MTELTVIMIMLMLINVFLLILMQYERGKSHEREMKLIKAVVANNVQELKMAEESPKDTQKRMKIENDLAVNAQKLQEKNNTDLFDKIAI